jgi:A/G-specific adenine glycosylase
MPTPVTPEIIRRLKKTVYGHFRTHGRRLPWRTAVTPYGVFISEIMLQQTQVDRVALKFGPFMRSLPGFAALAAAPLSHVLRLWQGLGYNRRALNLKKAAGVIMRDHGGALPAHPEILQTLPGVGKATAASIAAFAFDRPAVFLETNIRAVLIHHFFNDAAAVHDRELLPLAAAVLDRKHPRKWYSALMDYGAMLKKKHGNAARRSVHYKKQARFEGSRRQKRGAVVRLLLEKDALTSRQIAGNLGLPVRGITGVLDGLAADNIISKSNNRYCIFS